MDPAVWSRTLGDLVAEVPARAGVLDRLGLDYCCHGQRLLDDTCADAGLDVTDVAGPVTGRADRRTTGLTPTPAQGDGGDHRG
jgi:iron-sulfur cluster repair protein YtfE (RIC family)